MTFRVNKYQVIKKALSYELANFIFNYFLLKRDAVKWMYNNSHIHPNSLFSGVYYVKGQPNSGRLSLMDPRPGAQQCMPTRKKGKLPRELWRETYYDPIPGRLIMFPAWMWHKVEPNKSNDIRISVSFNFILF